MDTLSILLPGKRPFEFTMSYSITKCVVHLRKNSDLLQIWGGRNPIQVELTNLNEDTYSFKMQLERGYGIFVQLDGTLQRHSSETLVSGFAQFKVNPLSLIVTLAVAVVMFAFIATYGFNIFGMGMLFLLFSYIFMIGRREWLIGLLRNALQKEK